MFDFIVALIIGAGAGGWLFFQLNYRSGVANAGRNAVGGMIAGVIVFIFAFTLIKYVLHLQ